MQRPKHLKPTPAFPNFRKKNHDVTSDADARYNCIAFAYGVTNRRYWPTFHPDQYWPPNLPRSERVDAFVALFATQGYAQCKDGRYEEGVEKIAIWAKSDGTVTHAARQLGPNRWASKLGSWFDIEHHDNAASGGDYGEMVAFVSRKRP